VLDILGQLNEDVVKIRRSNEKTRRSKREFAKDVKEKFKTVQAAQAPMRMKPPVPVLFRLGGHSDFQITAFSDCYVLSDLSEWSVLMAVHALVTRLLKEGIMTRGAVVYGPLYHQNDILFGPAGIEAYELECNVANFPRILVTKEVQANISESLQLSKRPLLKQDVKDGLWFVNPFVPPLWFVPHLQTTTVPDSAKSRSIREYLDEVRRPLVTNLKHAEGDDKHLRKVSWLVSRYNEAAKSEGAEVIDLAGS
jgi:hypothetical protein